MAAKRAERARQLARDGSGSQRAAEEAQADLAVADAALKAARDRLALAARGVSASGAIPLEAPHAAVLRTLHATPGQTVSAGAPLFDLVAARRRVWLRVPLYAGDVDTIDRRAPVEVVPLGSPSTVRGVAAAPVAAPPTADATTAGVDLFYSLANRARTLPPGQRVSVRVPLRSSEESLVVPRSAVLFDAFGGTWVYEARDGGVFVRQRVALVDMVGDTAVSATGSGRGHPRGHGRRRGAVRHRVRCREVGGASTMMRALIAASLRLRLPVVALSVILMVVGIRRRERRPIRRLSRVRPAARRDPDRSARSLELRRRGAHQRAARGRDERRARPRRASVQVRARACRRSS